MSLTIVKDSRQLDFFVFQQDGQMQDTLAACNTGYTQTWVGEYPFDRLELDGETICLSVA